MTGTTAFALGGGATAATPGSFILTDYNHLSWGDLMTGYRQIGEVECVKHHKTALERDFLLWKDMIENPCVYGDDIAEWIELDEKLRNTRKSWKMESYWRELEEENLRKEAALQSQYRSVFTPIAKEAALLAARRWVDRDIQTCLRKFRSAATIIQAAVRGHQVRLEQPFRDCCMCLAHRVCPLETDVGFMCRTCAEQGPHADITGPLPDPWNWFRADYVDLAPIPEVEHCKWCLVPLEDGQTDRFCDGDCRRDYMTDMWRD